MEPIINPWLVYLAEKCTSVGVLCLIVAVFGVTFSIIWWMIYLAGETSLKVPKWIVSISVFCMVLSILLPSRETILTMITLKYITPNNVTVVGETAEDIVDYITDKIEEIMDEED